jgi:hypothetical protein
MILRRSMIVFALMAGLGITPSRADHGAVIVISGKRGVPVFINGQDATGAVVIGDWGLYRPGHVTPTIIRRHPWPVLLHCRCPAVIVPHHRHRRATIVRRAIVIPPAQRHYFPGGVSPPQLGRREFDPKASGPPAPAESFSRSWSSSSGPAPATSGQPPIVVAPGIVNNRFRPKRPPRKPNPPPRKP